MRHEPTYADLWREPINETYDLTPVADFFHTGEDRNEAVANALIKAARCLRDGEQHTFTGPELDVVRHLMPAHECHQSYAKHWVLEYLMSQHDMSLDDVMSRINRDYGAPSRHTRAKEGQ